MTYQLRTQSVAVLRSILAVPGAAKNIEDMYRGGKLLAEVLKLPVMPRTQEAMEVPVNVEMDPADVALIKQAFANAMERGVLSISEWATELVVKFEFVSLPKTP